MDFETKKKMCTNVEVYKIVGDIFFIWLPAWCRRTRHQFFVVTHSNGKFNPLRTPFVEPLFSRFLETLSFHLFPYLIAVLFSDSPSSSFRVIHSHTFFCRGSVCGTSGPSNKSVTAHRGTTERRKHIGQLGGMVMCPRPRHQPCLQYCDGCSFPFSTIKHRQLFVFTSVSGTKNTLSTEKNDDRGPSIASSENIPMKSLFWVII